MVDDSRLFDLEIVTPNRVFYKGQAMMVEFTAEDGDIGVYKKHIPMTTVLAPGVLTITEAEGKKQAAVHAGFAEILPEKVTILAEIAEWPEEIDLDRAKVAKDRAEERLRGQDAEFDFARAEIALKKALIRMDLGK